MDTTTAQAIREIYEIDPATVVGFIHYAPANGRYWPNAYVPTPHIRHDGVPWGVIVEEDGKFAAIGFTQGIDLEGVTRTSSKPARLGMVVTAAQVRYVSRFKFCPTSPTEYYTGDAEGMREYWRRMNETA